MAPFNDNYFAELEQDLATLSDEERASILRELRCHHEDALLDPEGDEQTLRLGLSEQVHYVGRRLQHIHNAARREARKRRSMLMLSTLVALSVIICSFIFPWIDGTLLAFLFGGLAVICAAVSLVGVWLPKPRIGRWLIWSGGTGLTLVGMPAVISLSSLYLICGPLLLVAGTRLQRV